MLPKCPLTDLECREQVCQDGWLSCGKSPSECGESSEHGGTIRFRGEQCREQSEWCEQRGRHGASTVLLVAVVLPVREECHALDSSASTSRTIVCLVADDLDQAQRGQRAVLFVCSSEVVETTDRRTYHTAQ